ncbi:MAG: HAD-IA family hydrolase [Desulfovibrionaceae bacterium]|nr:HAD-IA family hydrolase [Desulfovibrionaceae bacterium]
MASNLKILGHELRGIIYDCDGVMINSRAANTLFYNRVLHYFGLPPMNPEQEWYSFMASGMQALLYILPKELHPKIDYVVSEVVNYDRDIVPLLELMPNFREFVCDMHSLGLKQAMNTNRTSQGFEAVLKFFDFPRYFDPIMTVSVVEPKPSPQGALKILDTWKIPKEEVLYIGDSSHDQEAAKGAGVVFCAFNGLNLKGDLTTNSYLELKKILQEG